jgi:hypothetical protein
MHCCIEADNWRWDIKKKKNAWRMSKRIHLSSELNGRDGRGSDVATCVGLGIETFPSAVRHYVLGFVGQLALMSLRAVSRRMKVVMERHIREVRRIDLDADGATEPYVNARYLAFRCLCSYARNLTYIGNISPYFGSSVSLTTEAERKAFNAREIAIETENALLQLICNNRHTLRRLWCSTRVRTPCVFAALAQCPGNEGFCARGTGSESSDEALVRSCLDVIRMCSALTVISSSNWSDAQQERILRSAFKLQPMLRELVVDHLSPHLFPFLSELRALRQLEVRELATDPAPLLRRLGDLTALTTLHLGVTYNVERKLEEKGTDANPEIDAQWLFPASLWMLDLCVYRAVHVPPIYGTLPKLTELYTHALPPLAVAQLFLLAPTLQKIRCYDMPLDDSLLYALDDIHPSILAAVPAPNYPLSNVLERTFDAKSDVGRRLRKLVLDTSWSFPNDDHCALRRIADTCPALTYVDVRCRQLRQSCVAYLLATCHQLECVELLCATDVVETYDEFGINVTAALSVAALSVDAPSVDADSVNAASVDAASVRVCNKATVLCTNAVETVAPPNDVVLSAKSSTFDRFPTPFIVSAPNLRILWVAQHQHIVTCLKAPQLTWFGSTAPGSRCNLSLLLSFSGWSTVRSMNLQMASPTTSVTHDGEFFWIPAVVTPRPVVVTQRPVVPTAHHMQLDVSNLHVFSEPECKRRSSETRLSASSSSCGKMAITTLKMAADVDYTDLLSHVADICPSLTALDLSGVDTHVFTLLRAHSDWFPLLSDLTYRGVPTRDTGCAILRGLLHMRPLLTKLTLLSTSSAEIPMIRTQLAPFMTINTANLITRVISIT